MDNMTDLIQRPREAKYQCIDCSMEETAVDFDDAIAALQLQSSRIAELEAARLAYASEFPPDAEGLPDVGSIHANIRAMKRDADRWHMHVKLLRAWHSKNDVEQALAAVDAAIAAKGQHT
jgi:hypothetical protein